jgi:hypothetical protein
MVQRGISVDPILELELVRNTFFIMIPVSHVVLITGDNLEFAELIDDICYLFRKLIEREDLLINKAVFIEVGINYLPHIVLNNLIIQWIDLISGLFLVLMKFAHTTINI